MSYLDKNLQPQNSESNPKFLNQNNPAAVLTLRAINKTLKKKEKSNQIFPNKKKIISPLTRNNTISKGEFQIAGHSTGSDKKTPRIITYADQPEVIYKLINKNDIRGHNELEFYRRFGGSLSTSYQNDNSEENWSHPSPKICSTNAVNSQLASQTESTNSTCSKCKTKQILPKFLDVVNINNHEYLKLENVITSSSSYQTLSEIDENSSVFSCQTENFPDLQMSSKCSPELRSETLSQGPESDFLLSFADIKIGTPVASIKRWSGLFKFLNQSQKIQDLLSRFYIRFFIPCLEDYGFQLLGMKFYQIQPTESQNNCKNSPQKSSKISSIRYGNFAGRGAAFVGNKYVIEKFLKTCDIFHPDLAKIYKLQIIDNFISDIEEIIQWFLHENKSHILYGSSLIMSYKLPKKEQDFRKFYQNSSKNSSKSKNLKQCHRSDSLSTVDNSTCASSWSGPILEKFRSLSNSTILTSSSGYNSESVSSNFTCGSNSHNFQESSQKEASDKIDKISIQNSKLGVAKLIDFNNVQIADQNTRCSSTNACSSSANSSPQHRILDHKNNSKSSVSQQTNLLHKSNSLNSSLDLVDNLNVDCIRGLLNLCCVLKEIQNQV